MAADKSFAIQFTKDEEVICELIRETPELCKYSLTKFNYDANTGEKYTLNISIKIEPMTDKEKTSALFYSMFWGKKPTGEIIITSCNPKSNKIKTDTNERDTK
jgi:hypothetical protein